MARYRIGDRVRAGIYWGRKEDRMCRMCGRGRKHGSTCGRNVEGEEQEEADMRRCWERTRKGRNA